MSDRSRYGTALVVSLLLHLALLLRGQQWWASQPPEADDLLEVELMPMPAPRPPVAKVPPNAQPPQPPPVAAIPESKIVPMPEDGIERPSDDARFLSDRDNVVREEKVKRGDAVDTAKAAKDDSTVVPPVEKAPAPPPKVAKPAPPAPAQPPPAEKQDAPKQQEPPKAAPVKSAAAAPPAPAAKARPAAPAAKGSGKAGRGSGSTDTGRSGQGKQLALADLLPKVGDVDLGGPGGSGAAPAADTRPAVKRDLVGGRAVRFTSGTGIATSLPSVRDGDVTLLNTRAHQFAPFVRRVAGRVFQHLVIALHEAARRGVSGSGSEVGVVHAVMSADGSYVRAELREAHSDTRMAAPRVLLDMVGPRTFFDENPPEGAVGADGDIHFELQVRLRVLTEDRGATAGRRPMTMFEGYFGVGLLD